MSLKNAALKQLKINPGFAEQKEVNHGSNQTPGTILVSKLKYRVSDSK